MIDRNQLTDRFRNYRHIIDGGLATELELRGHDITGKLWSGHVLMNDPESIKELHYDYLVAGADIIITASYQLSLQGLAEAGYSATDSKRALKTSVECALLAREQWRNKGFDKSRNTSPLIAASIGPYGAYRADGSEYIGDYDLDQKGLVSFHRERFEQLLASDTDILACETIPTLSEALAFLELIEEYGDPPAWLSFTCKDDKHLSDGTAIVDAAKAVLDRYPDIAAIGVNCTPPQFVESLLYQLGSVADTPLLAYPNSGESWDARGRCWHGENRPEDFLEYASSWVKTGAMLVGGCCRTGPSHIAALRRAFAKN